MHVSYFQAKRSKGKNSLTPKSSNTSNLSEKDGEGDEMSENSDEEDDSSDEHEVSIVVNEGASEATKPSGKFNSMFSAEYSPKIASYLFLITC